MGKSMGLRGAILSLILVPSLALAAGGKTDAGGVREGGKTGDIKRGQETGGRTSDAKTGGAAERSQQRRSDLKTNNSTKPTATSTGVGLGNKSHEFSSPNKDTAKPAEGTTEGGKKRWQDVKNVESLLTKPADTSKEGLDSLKEDQKSTYERLQGSDTQKLYDGLKTAFDRTTTMKSYEKTMAEVDALLKGNKLTPAQKQMLERAVLIYLAETNKLPGDKAADALTQLKGLLDSFKDELADPKQKDEALDYILGTLAYYGKNGDGAVLLNVAKTQWDSMAGDPKARSGFAEAMGAMAKLHAMEIAKEIEAGHGPKDIAYDKVWERVNEGFEAFIRGRGLQNGVPVKDLEQFANQIKCKCMNHAQACKVTR